VNPRFSLSRTRTFLVGAILTVVAAISSCARAPAQEGARFLLRGQSLMEKKDYARAILEFRNAARLLPASAEAAYQLSLAHLNSGDYGSGVATLLHAAELDPQHAGAQLKIAELTAGADDFGAGVLEVAEKRLNSILAVVPDNGEAPGASVQARTNELEHLAAREPKDRDVKSRLVGVYMIQRRFPEAEREIENILEQNLARRKRQARVSFFKQLADRFFKPTTNPDPDQDGEADQDELDQESGATSENTQQQTKEVQNEEDAAVLVQRAHLYLATARAKEAEQDLLRSLHLNPRVALAHYLMSKVHQVHGSERARREELAEAVEHDPNWLAARLELAQARTESGGARAAIELLDQAPETQRHDVHVISELNRALLAAGDRIRLRKSIDQGLTMAKTPNFMLQDGYLRLQMHDLGGARKSLDFVLALDPENIRALDARSETYMIENQPALALSTLRAYALRYPKSAGLQYLLGSWLVRLNRPEEAKAAYRAAVDARPGFLAALERLVDLDLSSGKGDVARQTLALIAAAPGGKAPAEITLGVMQEGLGGNPESAIGHYRKALDVDPDNVTALNNLAYHLAGDKNHANEALSLALRVKKLDPSNAYVDDTIGWAYYSTGAYEPAVEHFEAAVARQPKASRTYHLAMAYFKVGAPTKARAMLQDALKMDRTAPEASVAIQLIGQLGKAQP
jgi:tetratricopeptide (TPR) repeat protein